MSVDLVQADSAGVGQQLGQRAEQQVEHQTPENKLHVAASSQSTASGNAPDAEIATTQSGAVPLLNVEHEVKVQLDSPADDIIVYQVLDTKSGALVLQVPSAEVLSGIHQTQELLQRIASRGKASTSTSDEAPAPVVTGEEKNHGNKL